jgi:hypothetical protein
MPTPPANATLYRRCIWIGCATVALASGLACDAWKKTFTRDPQGRITFNPTPLANAARAAFDKGVAFFSPSAENRRQATEAEAQAARNSAEQIARDDATAGQQRSADYYVPVSQDNQSRQIAVQRIDHKSNQPVGDVALLSEADLNEAARQGTTVKIDGHDLVGRGAVNNSTRIGG